MFEPFTSIFGLIFLVLWFLAWWKIFPRMGYNKWWTITMFIPGIGAIVLIIIAYSEWPNKNGPKVFDTASRSTIPK